MKKIIIYITAILMYGCGYDRFDDLPTPDGDNTLRNINIVELAQFYKGSPLAINQNMIVEGYVTSSDKAGNFYRTFIIQDHTHAIEIKAGLYDLHNIYPIGQRVVIRLKGMTLGAEYGVLQVGSKSALPSLYQTDFIGHRALLDKYVSRDTVRNPLTATTIIISSLSEDMCGRLIKVYQVHYTDPLPDSWAVSSDDLSTYLTTGYRKFKNTSGDSITVVCSGYATFAKQYIPSSEVNITGILMYTKSRGYMIKIRDIEDIE